MAQRLPVFLWTTILVLCTAVPAYGQRVIYVDTDAVGANDGSSWANAFVFLRDALAVAHDGDEVWVAEGVYRPDQGSDIIIGDRDAYFEVEPGVALMGGFSGDEVSPGERRPAERETVISGDLMGNDPLGSFPEPESPAYLDNSFRLLNVRSRANQPVTTFDGLTVRGANGSSGLSRHAIRVWSGPCVLRDVRIIENMGTAGSGAYLSGGCRVEHSVFARNNTAYDAALTGGALVMRGPGVISGSHFEDNYGNEGGGLRVGPDTVIVARSSFFRNRAWDGSAIAMTPGGYTVAISSLFISGFAKCSAGAVQVDEHTSFVAINSVFASNTTPGDCNELAGGGAVLVYNGTFDAFNSTFVNNSAHTGDVLIAHDGTGGFYNSIVAGNGGVSAPSDIELHASKFEASYVMHDEPLAVDMVLSGQNIQAQPIFRDPRGADGILGTLDDNFRLVSGSPGIDSGRNELVAPDYADLDGDNDRAEPVPFDLDNNPRFSGTTTSPAQVDIGAYEYPTESASDESDSPSSMDSACDFEVYPNPFTSHLSIRMQSLNRSRIAAYDVLGRRLGAVPTRTAPGWPDTRIELDTSQFAPGTYLFRVENARTHCTVVAVRVR